MIIGKESTSNSKYEPPCKSRPRFSFFDNKDSSWILAKFKNEKKDSLIFEKYNTKCNYFFVLELTNRFCIVDFITLIVTFSDTDKSILSSS